MSNYGYPNISGPAPGVLDPSQPGRILRHVCSTLAFLSYDPYTASGMGDAFKHDCQDVFLSQRVVAELIPGQPPTWKFIPSARRAPGIEDEGIWPRVVNICGYEINHTCTPNFGSVRTAIMSFVIETSGIFTNWIKYTNATYMHLPISRRLLYARKPGESFHQNHKNLGQALKNNHSIDRRGGHRRKTQA